MSARYGIDLFPEDGAKFQIEFFILNDEAALMIDTSGVALHKRGYRPVANAAPLRETLAAAMRNAFLSFVKDTVQDIRIPIARLSLGREKLFLRYVTEQGKVDLSAAQEELKRQFGVDVSLWAMGPRGEVSELGGLGPCGRVCCCNSWQRRYPSRLAPDRRSGSSLPSLMNGTCGRFKCCLAFERY